MMSSVLAGCGAEHPMTGGDCLSDKRIPLGGGCGRRKRQADCPWFGRPHHFSDPIIIVTIKQFFQKAVAEMTDRVVRNADLARAGDAERLAGLSRVATESVDEAAELIGRIFCPHDLKPLRASGPGFYARHNCAGFDGFSVNYVAYGGSVSIDPGCLERFFLLQLPLRGSAHVSTAGRDFGAAPLARASLLSPTVPTRMVWENDCAHLILLLERSFVEQRAAALAGTTFCAVEFDPVVDLTTPAAQALQVQLHGLVNLAEDLGPTRNLSPVAAADWRGALLDGLLTGQRPV
jgi:hypothetical protein